MIAKHPVRPCAHGQYGLVFEDDLLDFSRVPWRRQQRKVERQMRASEFLAVIGNEAFERKIDFTDQNPRVEFVDHAAHLRDHVMDLSLIGGVQRQNLFMWRPALAIVWIWRIVTKLRILDQMPDTSTRKPSTPSRSQKRITS